jgi:hypothetical protein
MMLVMGMYHAMDYQQTETLDNMDGIINKAGSSQIAM